MARSGWLFLLLLPLGCTPPTVPAGDDGWPSQSFQVTGSVALEARAALARDTVRVVLLLSNRGSAAGRAEFGVCAFGVQGIGRHGPAWDNHPADGIGCADFGLVVELAPGQSREIPVYRNAAATIRAGGAAGYYEVTVIVRESGALRRLRAGGLTL